MINVSNEIAIQRAHHLRLHKEKLKEIQNKSCTVDCVLNPAFYPPPRRNGFKVMFWTEKVIRENQILLEKLIRIKQKPHSFSIGPLDNLKGSKKVENLAKVEKNNKNVSPSLSTKNILKDYSKYKNYVEMRSKYFQRKIQSMKRLQAGFLNNQFRQKSHKIVKVHLESEQV
jgi:hypothetical protein